MVSKGSLALTAGILCVFVLALWTPQSVKAGMKRLSSFQEGTFALSQRNYVLTSEASQNDQYIDHEQADRISALSAIKPNTPADDDYPLIHYSLVDSLLLDSDLVIYYGDYSNCFFCAKTRYAYLSRNDISVTTFTPTLLPPTVFSVPIRAIEPFHGKMVTAVATTMTNYYLRRGFDRTYSGTMENGEVLVIHGCWTAWLHENPPFTTEKIPEYRRLKYEFPQHRYESTLRTGQYSVKFRETYNTPGAPQFGNTDQASLYGPYAVPGPPIIIQKTGLSSSP